MTEMSLFENIDKGAAFSDCGLYRYLLWRIWDRGRGVVSFVGLNPSTADETKDDPTIRRCINFAKSWGYGGINMLNLFAYRSTNPKILSNVDDPVGPDNDRYIRRVFEADEGIMVAAWGTQGSLKGRDSDVFNLPVAMKHSKRVGDCLHCLRTTMHGFPQHPLYVHGDTKTKRYFPFV